MLELTEIDGTKLPLNALHWLCSPATSTAPEMLTVAIQEQPTTLVYKGMIYPLLDGFYHIDIHDIVKDAVHDNDGFFTDDGYGLPVRTSVGSKLFNVTLGSVDVSFTVLDSELLTVSFLPIPVDVLSCPKTGYIRLQMPLCQMYKGLELELNNGNTMVISDKPEAFNEAGESLVKYISLDDIPAGATAFRAVAVLGDIREPASPIYHLRPGDWKHYYFRNDYGGFEDIPMCGNLTVRDEVSIKTAILKDGEEKVTSSRREVFTQSSGPLTKQAYVQLLSFLENSSIYDESEKLVVVTKIDANRGVYDDTCSLSFEYVLN